MSTRSGLVGENPPGPIWVHLGQFFAWAGKMQKLCQFSLVGQWAAPLATVSHSSICLRPVLIPIAPPRVDSSKGPPRKIGKHLAFFGFFRSMEKMAWDGPKWGREDFFPTNPDLANILGRTDLDFENFYFLHFLDPKFLDFQVPRFPKSGLGRA